MKLKQNKTKQKNMTKRNPITLWDHITKKIQQNLEINNTGPPKYDNTDSPKPNDDIFWGKIEEEFHDPNHPKMNCPLDEIIDNYFDKNNKDKKKGSI